MNENKGKGYRSNEASCNRAELKSKCDFKENSRSLGTTLQLLIIQGLNCILL